MILSAFVFPHPPIVLPEIGKGRQTEIQKTIDAFEECAKQIAQQEPDTIVLVTPHSISYADYIHISPDAAAEGDLRQFGAADVFMSVDYDIELSDEIEKFAVFSGISAGTLGQESPRLDHGAIIPLWFVNKYYKNYKVVRISISGLSVAEHYRFGKVIAESAKHLGKNVVFIASGDLSHKLPEPDGVKLDAEITGSFADGDFLRLLQIPYELCQKGAECGLRAFIIMAGVLDKTEVTAKLLSYEGPFGVGYAVASFIPCGTNSERDFLARYEVLEKIRMEEVKSNESDYVKTARFSLEHFVRTGRTPLPSEVAEALHITKSRWKELFSERAGVFVCIKKRGELRGCIGTISPVSENIAKEIIRNSVNAASEDPRFEPVDAGELTELVYTVDLLKPPEKIESVSQLDVKRYGVIVTSVNGNKRGLLLPNLDSIDTVQQQVSIAKRKAGISDDEAIFLERFEVTRYT
ncbi:MAG: AmmeMemoRadiSam system protein A [Oscillospiraceae bacterium]|nr:AmmeMemoRadiSam system protein A [Oscillospiraceae bacterium]